MFHHGCEPQHQEEAGGGRHRAGAEGHHVRAYHLIELQKVCEAILGTFLDIVPNSGHLRKQTQFGPYLVNKS